MYYNGPTKQTKKTGTKSGSRGPVFRVGLVWFRIRVSVSIGGRVRVSFFGSFRVRVSVRGRIRVRVSVRGRIRVWFWLGSGSRLDPKTAAKNNHDQQQQRPSVGDFGLNVKHSFIVVDLAIKEQK